MAMSTTSLADWEQSPGAFARVRHYLFRFTMIPNVRTMTAQAAARRASVRIASIAMPKQLCATTSDRIATVAAPSTEKMGMNTRPMQTQ